MSFLAILFSIIITNIDGNYQLLSNIKLPVQIAYHITVIYNETIYLFGGVEESGENIKWWKMDISSWNIQLNEDKTDIISQPIGNWTEINPAPIPPDNRNVQCLDPQCAVLVDHWLFLVAPRFDASSNLMYKIDLSADPPTFEDTASYNSTLATYVYKPCIARAGNYIYYATTNGWLYAGRYNVINDIHERLDNMANEAPQGGYCRFSRDKSRLYVLGGNTVNTVNWYSVSDKTWTNHQIGDNGGQYDWTTSVYEGGDCIVNPFKPIIECFGGYLSADTKNRLFTQNVYHFSTSLNTLINTTQNGLTLQVMQHWSTMTYVLSNTSIEGSVLYLLSGGYLDQDTVFDSIYYKVESGLNTPEPTAYPSAAPTVPTEGPTKMPSTSPTIPTTSPSRSPSKTPSNAPSNMPSKAPSNMPSREPTVSSRAPSKVPTDAPEPDNAMNKYCTISYCLFILCFYLIFFV